MVLFENFNRAKQKYGEKIVKELSDLGLPPQYLLSACRFHNEQGTPIQTVVYQFKEWTKYVIKYSQYDVNRLSYDEFLKILSQEKSKHIVPNLIWQNEIASLGRLYNAKDVQLIPVKNQWCIKSQRWFDNYTSKGYVFFVIYLPKEPLPFTFVVVAICDGDVEYYDSQDYEQFEDLRGGNENNSDHELYQSKLPQEIVSYLYNIAISQTEESKYEMDENKQYNKNRNMKQTFRLRESELKRMIAESVRRALNEDTWYDANPHKFSDKLANALNKLKTDAYSIVKIALEESQMSNTNVSEKVVEEVKRIYGLIENLCGQHFTNSDVY